MKETKILAKGGVLTRYPREGGTSSEFYQKIVGPAYVSDSDSENSYVVVRFDTSNGKKLLLDRLTTATETNGVYTFRSSGYLYSLSPFNESHTQELFFGLPLTPEVMEEMYVSGYQFLVNAVSSGEDLVEKVYLKIGDDKVYAWSGSKWSAEKAVPGEATVVSMEAASMAVATISNKKPMTAELLGIRLGSSE